LLHVADREGDVERQGDDSLWSDRRQGRPKIFGNPPRITGLRLDREQEFDGADLSIHKVSASPERETNW
jgi:hypothetical protein